jgi:hypothetical protein
MGFSTCSGTSMTNLKSAVCITVSSFWHRNALSGTTSTELQLWWKKWKLWTLSSSIWSIMILPRCSKIRYRTFLRGIQKILLKILKGRHLKKMKTGMMGLCLTFTGTNKMRMKSKVKNTTTRSTHQDKQFVMLWKDQKSIRGSKNISKMLMFLTKIKTRNLQHVL